jgi:flagellar basal-body rod protein FlgB
MFAKLTDQLNFQAKGLVLRSERQRIIASNIANADTPGYAGRDINFKEAMGAALGEQANKLPLAGANKNFAQGRTHPQHIAITDRLVGQDGEDDPNLQYTIQTQPAMDGNSVDLDRERANFADNSVRYEATLRFINGSSKTILSAIQGQ